ncbi:MAG: hypothetical protein ACOY94_00605, partial [Bacillota bacterium]
IAARRLSITPAEIAEGIRRRRERRQALATDSSATAALGKIRERRAGSPPPEEDRARILAARPARPAEPQAKPQPEAQAKPQPEAVEGSSFTDRLLAAKRKRQ